MFCKKGGVLIMKKIILITFLAATIALIYKSENTYAATQHDENHNEMEQRIGVYDPADSGDTTQNRDRGN